MITAIKDGFKKVVKGDADYPRITIQGSFATVEVDDFSSFNLHRDRMHDLLGVLAKSVTEMDQMAALPQDDDA